MPASIGNLGKADILGERIEKYAQQEPRRSHILFGIFRMDGDHVPAEGSMGGCIRSASAPVF